jgi:hypothetical protein
VLNPSTTAIQLRALFNNQSGRYNVPFDVGSAAEDQFLAGENVALDCSIYFCNSDLDYSFCDLRAGANDECAVR